MARRRSSSNLVDAPSVRWLDDDEQAAWRAFLAMTHGLFAQLELDLQRDSGLSHADYQVLVQLSEAPERRLRMSELALSTDSSRSRLTHAVARLEERGWVRRERCDTDRRGANAVLTEAGFAVLESAAPDHVESVRRHLFDQLEPSQVAQLGRISRAVAEHLVAEGAVPMGFPPPCPTQRPA
jgi:DNA-binding MarR family transcriptional regulator